MRSPEELFKQLLQLRRCTPDTVQTLYVEELQASTLEQFLGQICAEKMVKAIVVCDKISLSSKKISFYKALCDLDIFERKHLDLLLRGHRLIPPHERLSEDDAEHVLSHYGKINMPLMLTTDPMSILHDFKAGDVIKITRQRGIYFRVVIDN